MNLLRFVALSLAAASLFTCTIVADDPKSDKPVESKDFIKKPAQLPFSADQSEKLEALLKEMGVNYEKKTEEKTHEVYFAVKEYGADNFYFELEESKNKKYLWISFPCSKVPETGIPAQIMEKMLNENTQMGTASFQLFPNSKMIYLKKSLANNNITAKTLKEDINWLIKDANRTRALWDNTQWSKTAQK